MTPPLNRNERRVLDRRGEAVEHLVHLLPALERLHVAHPALDVGKGRVVAADQLAEAYHLRAEVVGDRDAVPAEIGLLRSDQMVVENLEPDLRLLFAPLERRGLRLVAAPLV